MHCDTTDIVCVSSIHRYIWEVVGIVQWRCSGRAERDGVIGALVGIASPEGGTTALVVGVRVRVGAVVLCDKAGDVSGIDKKQRSITY